MIENSWLFGRHADPALGFHDFVLHQASVIAVMMIVVALGGLVVSRLRKSLKAERSWWIPLALIPLAVLFLQLPISLPVWNLLPKLRFLQFPWRWLLALEAPMAIFFASAVWPAASARRWSRAAVASVCAVVFLAVTAAAGLVFFQPCDEEDAVAGMLAQYRSGMGVAGTDEYEPPGADDSLLATGLPGACLVSDPSTVLGEGSGEPDAAPVWDAAQGSCEEALAASPVRVKSHAEHFEIVANASQAGYLILRLRSYPAWRVEVNDRPTADLPQRGDGLIAVPVRKGPVDLTVDWTATPDAVAGRWVSGQALLLLAAVWLLERRLQRPSSSRLS
jgi:hypothetical protein